MTFDLYEGAAAPCASGPSCTSSTLPTAGQGTIYYDSATDTLWEYTGAGTTNTVTLIATGNSSNGQFTSNDPSLFSVESGTAPSSPSGVPYSAVFTVDTTSGANSLWVANSQGVYQFLSNVYAGE
jgi:hypothetical protein